MRMKKIAKKQVWPQKASLLIDNKLKGMLHAPKAVFRSFPIFPGKFLG